MEIVEGTGPLVEPLPFTDGEYAQRLAALRATMAAPASTPSSPSGRRTSPG
ncbi:MAG TPA: hypothetical protein VM422_02465 [Amaricoccus sp.]|nr:hypothetical protein [Amaricoccus sp.]